MCRGLPRVFRRLLVRLCIWGNYQRLELLNHPEGLEVIVPDGQRGLRIVSSYSRQTGKSQVSQGFWWSTEKEGSCLSSGEWIALYWAWPSSTQQIFNVISKMIKSFLSNLNCIPDRAHAYLREYKVSRIQYEIQMPWIKNLPGIQSRKIQFILRR